MNGSESITTQPQNQLQHKINTAGQNVRSYRQQTTIEATERKQNHKSRPKNYDKQQTSTFPAKRRLDIGVIVENETAKATHQLQPNKRTQADLEFVDDKLFEHAEKLLDLGVGCVGGVEMLAYLHKASFLDTSNRESK